MASLGSIGLLHILEVVGEQYTLEVRHCQEGLALVLPHVIDRADVGMAQPGRGPGLAVEPMQIFGILIAPQHGQLQGHLAI